MKLLLQIGNIRLLWWSSCHSRGDHLARNNHIRNRLAVYFCLYISRLFRRKKWFMITKADLVILLHLPGKLANLLLSMLLLFCRCNQKKFYIVAQKSKYGIQIGEERKYNAHCSKSEEQELLSIIHGLELLAGFSITLKKNLKRVALLSYNRNVFFRLY